ncbi:MAG: helix-turn-helix domain-containing protein, partial [Actinobacteria bacterium]|nr:helix-turn-helix domain-containing protein [Actinomycetota bacterium]
MRAAELGAFLRSRRGRLSPADVGLVAGPADRRRAPGLRREEVATMAGVAVSWLARLEQGRARSVSPEVLAALASALRLDDVERAHLFALAGFRVGASSSQPAPSSVTPALRTLLDALDPNPAYLLDRAWNIVAWNAAEAALFAGLAAYENGDAVPNLLELIFGDDDLVRLMVDHAEEQARLVAQFRVHCTDWPDDAEVRALVASLLA